MWLTPNVPNGGRSVPEALVQSKGMTEDGEKRTVGLESQVKYWATPTGNEHTGAGHPNSKQGALNLRSQVSAWPTPRGTDGTKGGPNQAGSKGDLMFPSAAAQWPTPSASIANDGESPETWHARAATLKAKHGNGNGAGLPLTVAAAQWPTPAARDYRSESGGGQLCDQQTERNTGPDPEHYGCPLFAPGPTDPRWPAIIAAQPWFSPALSIEGEHDAKAAYQAAEPLLRGAPDGLANGLDFSHRAQRLKCVGNGVVALQAATAFIILARRAGFMPNQPLALINIAQAATNSVAELETT
jgi:hypothetical protein